MVEAGRWPKPADARCKCPVRGHRARDRHGGTTAGAGNDDEVGCGCGGEHRRAKDSTLGKVVGGGTHRATRRCGGGISYLSGGVPRRRTRVVADSGSDKLLWHLRGARVMSHEKVFEESD
jgi:hypothetical protein